MLPDFEKADSLLSMAAESDRNFLYEHEVYDLLAAVGIGPPPGYYFIDSPDSLQSADKLPPGDKLVLKIADPEITHKTDVGGVRMVNRDQAVDAVHSMAGISGGVLAVEYVEHDPGFGTELFIGMRLTREFGPVINCGLGGVDTELYAKEITPGRAGITVSPGISTDSELIDSFSRTISFEILTGLARGHESIVPDEKIRDLLERFHALVWRFSQLNPDADYWFTEFEINPLVCSDGSLIPVDGLLKFRPAEQSQSRSPVDKIGNLLKPKNVCAIGVSGKDMNLGRVILRNLLDANISPETVAIVKQGDREIDGVKCYPTIDDLPGKFDLIVLSIAAQQVPDTIREIIDRDKAESIILITGGMGEVIGGAGIEDEVRKILIDSRNRDDKGPVMVGGNSLGIISRPGGYDTTFVSPDKLPRNPDHPIGRNLALLSQSGAFAVSRMSNLGNFSPRYGIITGNQIDLGIADFLLHLSNDDEVRVFGCYVEGFKNGEGLRFAETARKIILGGRDVIVYKAGRSERGRTAASGHTAAIAGDWHITESVLTSVGCMVAHSFDEWSNFLMLSTLLDGRPIGEGRTAAVSNAGFEAVGAADNFGSLQPAEFSTETRKKLQAIFKKYRFDAIQDIRNPMDLTPMAVDRTHVEVAKILSDDPNVDILLHACVPLSHSMKTLPPGSVEGDGITDPESFSQLLIQAWKTEIRKPLVVVVDSGRLYDPMADMFLDSGIPVFRSSDEAVRNLERWIGNYRW